jgi:hypothetical protein
MTRTRGVAAVAVRRWIIGLLVVPGLVSAAGMRAPAAEAAPVPAQAANYKPGDRIAYRISKNPDVWEEGVFLRATPDGTQPIIRKKPNEFFKDGFETAFQWENIRPFNARPRTPAPSEPPRAAPPPITGKGLMTQAEILDFLRTRLGEDPFAHPQREQVKQELTALIKRRGVNFRYETLSDFGREIAKYGLTSEITFPLQANYGPPTRQAWLMGTWNLSKISPAVDFRKGDRIYRRMESGVNNVGVLTLNGNGSYVWKSSSETQRGAWRKATAEEMKSQGGDGIVLLNAKGGWDWIVMQDRAATIRGDWIAVSEINSRQVREFGRRQAGGK